MYLLITQKYILPKLKIIVFIQYKHSNLYCHNSKELFSYSTNTGIFTA